MKNWEFIRSQRGDLTDYVFHMTKQLKDHKLRLYNNTREVLGQIIAVGFLKPTFAFRKTRNKNQNPTIRGPFPAVCYTEQPLDQLLVTLKCFGISRYEHYGFAFNKKDLYEYGGRPAIYFDEKILGHKLRKSEEGYEAGKEVFSGCLPKDFQYLWVRYVPGRSGQVDYPVDFTHEREWRCRVWSDSKFGNNLSGVPLLLPTDINQMIECHGYTQHFVHKPNYRIIVRFNNDISLLRNYICKLPMPESPSNYQKIYFESLNQVRIISLEEVANRLKQGDERYRKIETIPENDD